MTCYDWSMIELVSMNSAIMESLPVFWGYLLLKQEEFIVVA